MEKEKLKTLEEIKFTGDRGDNIVIYEEAKAEAVKWVKAIDRDGPLRTPRGYFIEFFNLTEEDLK